MNKFLGKLVATRGVNNRIADDENFAKEVLKALSRYKNHDWGELCEEDKQLNDEAIKTVMIECWQHMKHHKEKFT